ELRRERMVRRSRRARQHGAEAGDRERGSIKSPVHQTEPLITDADGRTRCRVRPTDLELLALSRLALTLLLGPGARERVAHAVVMLVTRRLEDRPDRLFHRILARPRPHPGVRIVDRELVEDPIVRNPRQTLGDDEMLARAAKRSLSGEVRGRDHERIAVPVTARRALPLANLLRQRRAAVERDHARI